MGAEQGVTSSTITIGTSQPLTGGAAVAGEGFVAGVQKAVAAINQSGGIDGRTIKLVSLDNQFAAPETLANFRELIQQDKVYAIVVPAGTATIPSAWPLVTQTGIPIFGPYEPADPNLPSVFELVSGQTQQAMVETKYLVQQGMTKIGFVGTNDANGQENIAGLKAEAPKVHADVVYSVQLPTGSDASSEVLAAKQAGAQALLLGTNNTEADLVIKAAAAINWHPVIIGNASAMGTGGATTVGPLGSLANGVIGALTSALPTATSSGVVQWSAQGPESKGANYDL
ncbi:MAG TPA: ABC transporter substrate-binding protein, partial [Acidimicrobiales bacterium]|nr:ABC transporter substrate-binding protein [Acidimicrobiales bacterium]